MIKLSHIKCVLEFLFKNLQYLYFNFNYFPNKKRHEESFQMNYMTLKGNFTKIFIKKNTNYIQLFLIFRTFYLEIQKIILN